MAERIGVKTVNLVNHNELKHDLLFFDRIIINVDSFRRVQAFAAQLMTHIGQDPRLVTHEIPELLDWLTEREVLIPTSPAAILKFDWDMRFGEDHTFSLRFSKAAAANSELDDWSDLGHAMRRWWGDLAVDGKGTVIETVDDVEPHFDQLQQRALLESKFIYLLKYLSDADNLYSMCVAGRDYVGNTRLLREQQVAKIVIRQFPTPLLTTPWEDIMEFRAEPENRRRLLALRNWVSRSVRGSIPTAEIQEELEWLLAEHEHAFKLQRIKHEQHFVEFAVVTLLEVLEDILKLNWSTAAKKLFEIRKRNVDFAINKSNLPGREVAYITGLREWAEK